MSSRVVTGAFIAVLALAHVATAQVPSVVSGTLRQWHAVTLTPGARGFT